jgi:hypothetical protein
MIWFYKKFNNRFHWLKLLVKAQWKFPTHFILVLLHFLLSIMITLIIVQFVSIGYLDTTFIFVFLFELGKNFIILSKPLIPLVGSGDHVLQPRLQYLWFLKKMTKSWYDEVCHLCWLLVSLEVHITSYDLETWS